MRRAAVTRLLTELGSPSNHRLALTHLPRLDYAHRFQHLHANKEVAMKTAIVIPSRYGSTRLPVKPLLRETGKYLVQHVYERACRSKADQVVVATDDERIARAVQEFGGKVVMTRSDHETGTDRVAEVARGLKADVIINVQGDEPLVEPAHLDVLIDLMGRGGATTEMATLAVPVANMEEYHNPACVKVVCGTNGQALYFSRSPIPFVRDAEPDFEANPNVFLRHLGLYGFRRDFLLRVSAAPSHPLERFEKLEQLRALAMGAQILVGVVDASFGGVDTPADYARFVAEYRCRQAAQAA
jgi:3-deoxy-manno-octulosonate cytidylyltransferase (CMP-KDO synthetase)